MKRIIATLLALCIFIAPGLAMAETLSQKAAKLPYRLEVDLKNQLVIAYSTKDDSVVRTMICSTGLRSGATPSGTFYLPNKRYSSERGPWHALYGNCFGRYATRIKGSILFHSILYKKTKVDTLIGDSWKDLGKRASMGCIRMTPLDAQWIAYNCAVNTKVVIRSGSANADRKVIHDEIKASLPKAKKNGTLGVWEPTLEPTAAPVFTLKTGNNGSAVKKLQTRLKALGFFEGTANGKYQASTEKAVKRFEKAAGLKQTGIATVSLQNKIYGDDAPTGNFVTLKKGDKGPAVKAMQQRLKTLKFFKKSANGTFSAATLTAVKAFAISEKLPVQNIATPKLQKLLQKRAEATTQDI